MKGIWKKNKITLLVLIILIITGTIILGINGFEKSPDLKAGTKIEIYVPQGYEKQPKNVIVMLFDGMGSRILERTLPREYFMQRWVQ